VRRRLIQFVMPFLLCAIPVLAAGAVFSALETKAREFYLENLTNMDRLILAVGSVLFVFQMLLSLRALRWRGTGFDERSDNFLSHLAQAAEWFPLLGLLGTVAAILQTFSGMTGNITQTEIIRRYAPAITATGSGLFMALINILPTWIVSAGRDLIRKLGGSDEPEPQPQPREPVRPPSAPVDNSRARPGVPGRIRPPTGTDAGHR
jgi:MotA/TolQ/ExbB proton channel family